MYQKKYAIEVLRNRFDIGRMLRALRRVGSTSEQIMITTRHVKSNEQLYLVEDSDSDAGATGVLSGTIAGGLLGAAVFGGMAGLGRLVTAGML